MYLYCVKWRNKLLIYFDIFCKEWGNILSYYQIEKKNVEKIRESVRIETKKCREDKRRVCANQNTTLYYFLVF